MMIYRPSVLLLEDEALIALDIENALLDAGAGDVTLLTSCAAAMAWLAENTPDVAIVDIFLRDGECMDAAQTLSDRRVPFIMHTARRRVTSENHKVFLNGMWISKPSASDTLVEAVKSQVRLKLQGLTGEHLGPTMAEITDSA